jgi:hypothetical protein
MRGEKWGQDAYWLVHIVPEAVAQKTQLRFVVHGA